MSHQIKDISEGTNLTFYIVRRRQKTKKQLGTYTTSKVFAATAIWLYS